MLSLLIILGPEREKGLLKKGQRLTMGKAFAVNIYFYLHGRGAGRQTDRRVYRCSWKPGEGVGSPRDRFKGGYEAPNADAMN